MEEAPGQEVFRPPGMRVVLSVPARPLTRPDLPDVLPEGTMSRRNGDKARFGRQQRAKILLRKHTREAQKRMAAKTPEAPIAPAR